MSKINKERVKPDFRSNPDNIKVNDWVFRNGDIGFVEGVAKDTESMLQFWVRWNNDSTPTSELPDNLKKLNRPVAVGNINYTIDLDLLVLSPELQQRVKLDKSVVSEYAEAFRNHVKFPPITIWYLTDEEYKGDPLLQPAYLIDGFHRAEAAKIAGIKELPFIRKQGTRREALLYSTSINSTHGIRRSNEDKRKSVLTLLEDPEWSQWSDRAIAKQCNVSNVFVSKLRKSIILEKSELSVNVNTLSKKDDIILGNGKRKYIKNGKEFIMDVKDALNDPEIFPELPGTPLLDTLENNPDTLENNPNSDSELEDSGKLRDDDSAEDNQIFGEDVIKDLDEDLVDEDKPKNQASPLSVGDKVKVLGTNGDFGGKSGVITRNIPPDYVMVKFDNGQRNAVKLSDLELIQSPKSSSKPKRPQKKEIYIKEGLNYYAGSIGSNLRWYLQVRKHIYEGLKIYQDKVEAIGIERILSDFLKEKGILKTHPDDCTVPLEYSDEPSPINSLNYDTRLKLEAIIKKHGIEKILGDYE